LVEGKVQLFSTTKPKHKSTVDLNSLSSSSPHLFATDLTGNNHQKPKCGGFVLRPEKRRFDPLLVRPAPPDSGRETHY